MYSVRHLFLSIFLIVFIGGCGGKIPESMISEQAANVSKNDERTKLLNERITKRALTGTESVADDYLIGPGDLLEITVFNVEELSKVVRVNSRGVVTYPLLGEVELASLTTQETEEKLEKLLGAKYLEDPNVSVFIREYKSKQVAVIGAVGSPGNYELLGKGTLLDALALAGGLSDNAGKTVFLSQGGQDRQYEIDIDELLVKGNMELNLPVQMGDTIIVPEAGTYYVNGAVNSPGTFSLRENISVSQAIEIAGGLLGGARGSSAKLLRYQDGKRQIIPVDIKAIQRGEQKDIALQDQDVVYVGKNPIIGFFQSLRFGLSMWPFPLSVSGSVPQ